MSEFLFLIQLQAEACNFIEKETLGQVFSSEFCEIFKNILFTKPPCFYRTPLADYSVACSSIYSFRSSLSQMFLKMGVLKSFAIFTWKYLFWSIFLIKLEAFRSPALLKRDSNTGIFLWILQNFYEQLFYRTSADCFSTCSSFHSLHPRLWFSFYARIF